MRKRYLLVLIADQKEFPRKAYWAPFFSKMATFVQGPERTARLNNAAITMGKIKRVKRGYYISEVVLLTTEPRSLPEGEITKRMIAFIEDTIREQPANYLWSHDRWKYTFDLQKHTAL
jgi:KDO2-lipid IV(A) lauroyltransferase